jgi:predicted ATPase
MQINIKNIGNLPKAKIILDGLTIIAGENDTGKSTIGKIIFSIINAHNSKSMNTMVNLVFDSQISNQGEVIVEDKTIPIYSNSFGVEFN